MPRQPAQAGILQLWELFASLQHTAQTFALAASTSFKWAPCQRQVVKARSVLKQLDRALCVYKHTYHFISIIPEAARQDSNTYSCPLTDSHVCPESCAAPVGLKPHTDPAVQCRCWCISAALQCQFAIPTFFYHDFFGEEAMDRALQVSWAARHLRWCAVYHSMSPQTRQRKAGLSRHMADIKYLLSPLKGFTNSYRSSFSQEGLSPRVSGNTWEGDRCQGAFKDHLLGGWMGQYVCLSLAYSQSWLRNTQLKCFSATETWMEKI